MVLLLSHGAPVDSAALDFEASDSTLTEEAADPTLGAGDPLAVNDSLRAWSAGTGEGAVSTAARSVRLSSDRFALMVHQGGGFEHVKRRHYLFTSDGRKLQRIWTAQEGAGPAWSAVALVKAAGGQSEELVHLMGFQPGGADPDTFEARRYGWDASTRRLAEQPLGSLYAVVAGSFANAAAARNAAQTCLAGYLALAARDLGLSGSGVVLAAITTQRSLAEANLVRSDRSCAGNVTRRIVEVKSTPARQH